MKSDREQAAYALETPSREGVVDASWHAWLEDSHTRPEEFRAALFAELGARAALPLSSAPAGPCNLYHDAVARHCDGTRVALRWYARDHGWRTLRYDELAARCERRANAWAAQGVVAGAVLCVVAPDGVEQAISVLSALRLGACVSLLAPRGDAYLARRLAALAPAHIAAAPAHARLLGEFAGLRVHDESETSGARTSMGAERAPAHTYAADEACGLLFSPLRAPPHQPVLLTAGDAFLGAAQAGLQALALRPGDALAAPGFHSEQHQPCLLLAALLCGACFVHVDQSELARDPALLGELELRALGIGNELRELLRRAAPPGPPPWHHWFRNPEEPLDWIAWREFIEAGERAQVPCSNVLIEAASGGVLLSSPRRAGRWQLRYLMNVVPAPGRPFALLDYTGSGQPAAGEVGVYAPVLAEQPIGPMHAVIAKLGSGEYLYGNTVTPRRSGRVYPSGEVSEALAGLDFVRASSVVAVIAGGASSQYRFVLLVFTGAEPVTRHRALLAERVRRIEDHLRARLGAELLPDRVEMFPLYARAQAPAGEPDHAWCRVQYLTGTAFRKARTPLFLSLSAVRGALLSATATPPTP